MLMKTAKTRYDIHPLLSQRWSPRSFTGQPVSNESLQRIFEAARWAPSSFNEQPWRFIAGIKGDKTWDMIYNTLVTFNQQWAGTAPVLALAIGKKTSSKNNRPNSIFQYDVGQSVAYITFQAMHEGLYVHQMGGFDTVMAAKLFNIPEDYQVLTAFAIGYLGSPDNLDESLAEMEKAPRERSESEKIVFQNSFNAPAEFL